MKTFDEQVAKARAKVNKHLVEFVDPETGEVDVTELAEFVGTELELYEPISAGYGPCQVAEFVFEIACEVAYDWVWRVIK